ncbi:MAG TPA: flagellar basal body rod protein FlgB [Candidatus Sulfotelmatobacter sp.]|nr:flagellar basal body rod protein FlgB [Candidatus Sulfotelmatobacter sp.]
MDLNKLPIFAALKRQMDWLNQRQQVIAQNIANADTPGYVPHDLQRPSFKDLMGAQDGAGAGGTLQPTMTSPLHLSLKQNAAFTESAEAKPAEEAPSGNAVKIEDELVKLADAQIEFSTATSLYKKHVSLILTALGKG